MMMSVALPSDLFCVNRMNEILNNVLAMSQFSKVETSDSGSLEAPLVVAHVGAEEEALVLMPSGALEQVEARAVRKLLE